MGIFPLKSHSYLQRHVSVVSIRSEQESRFTILLVYLVFVVPLASLAATDDELNEPLTPNGWAITSRLFRDFDANTRKVLHDRN